MYKLVLLLLLLLNSCYLSHFPLTPGITESSTYKVSGDGFFGTGWAVDKHHLVTAGHVCENGQGAYIIGGSLGRRFLAHPVEWVVGVSADLCVLETEATLDNWLVISDHMPRVGETIWYSGYPGGEFGTYTGKYLGKTDDTGYNDAAFDAPCAPGASGSATVIGDGVWGVLVRIRTHQVNGQIEILGGGCVAIPLAPLKKLLDDTDVHYTTTPHLPPPVNNGEGDEPRQGG